MSPIIVHASTKQNNNKKINCKVERNFLDEEKGSLLDIVYMDTQQQVPMKRIDNNEIDSNDYDSGGDGDGDNLFADLPPSKGSSLSDADNGSDNDNEDSSNDDDDDDDDDDDSLM
jgi:hypothetical protein